MCDQPNAALANPAFTPAQWRALLTLTLCLMLAMSTYLSGTVVLPQLQLLYGFTPAIGSFVTIMVQCGFVGGALLSALLTLPDRIAPHVLVAIGGVMGGVLNAVLLATPPLAVVMLVRFGTGVCISLVYPISVKLLATHFKTYELSLHIRFVCLCVL